MISPLTSLFRKPSSTMLAQAELEDAKRSLLSAQSAAEYAKRMSEYHTDRIKRLTAILKASADGEQS